MVRFGRASTKPPNTMHHVQDNPNGHRGQARRLELWVGCAWILGLVREGTPGDCYYAIVEGTVEVRRHGRPIALLQRGDGLGEIALLRSVPRTATAVAATTVVTYRLARGSFLGAVNGHVPTLESADRMVRDVRARDAVRDARPPPE